MTPAPATPDPHRATVDVYEARGPEWEELRSPRLDEVAAFTGSLGPDDRPVVDLGCGPGWHLPDLPPGTFAVDAAAAMLALTPKYADDAPRAQADLRELPFRRGGLGAAWANKSYVHVDRRAMPMAWWDLHRSLRVGAPAFIGVFGGDEDHAAWEDDDFAGRSFSHWPDDLLGHVVEGAGFEVREWARRPESDGVTFHALTLRRARTLADTVGAGMRLLLVGLNPSVHAADVGVGFARPGNRAWPALLESGDLLVREGHVPGDLHVGDLVATPVTGAYGHSMGSNYNKVMRPAVVFVRDGEARQVVRRETLEDLLATDLG